MGIVFSVLNIILNFHQHARLTLYLCIISKSHLIDTVFVMFFLEYCILNTVEHCVDDLWIVLERSSIFWYINWTYYFEYWIYFFGWRQRVVMLYRRIISLSYFITTLFLVLNIFSSSAGGVNSLLSLLFDGFFSSTQPRFVSHSSEVFSTRVLKKWLILYSPVPHFVV